MITEPPSGTRDFLPGDVRLRLRVMGAIRTTFERHGFEPMDTPAFERLETLLDKYGEEGEKLIFKILRRGERGDQGEVDLALRYDLTVPLSRVYAQHRQALPRPFRRYQMGPVWRADRPGRGRLRELYQCDLDIVGSASTLAEVEVLGALAASYHAVGLRDFSFQLNSRKVLTAVLAAYGVPEALTVPSTVALDKLDKIGAAGVERELVERGVAADVVRSLRADLEADDVPAQARERGQATDAGRAALLELDEIFTLLEPVLPESVSLRFAPFLARGMDYYTGCIFEVTHPGLPLAIGGGGRYDNLLAQFSGSDALPAFGGSMGVDRTILLVQQAGAGPAEGRSQVMVGVFSDDLRADALRTARDLRQAGLRVEVHCGAGQLGKQIRAASQAGVAAFVFQGPDEKARGEAVLKLLASGEQETLPMADLVARVSARLG